MRMDLGLVADAGSREAETVDRPIQIGRPVTLAQGKSFTQRCLIDLPRIIMTTTSMELIHVCFRDQGQNRQNPLEKAEAAVEKEKVISVAGKGNSPGRAS